MAIVFPEPGGIYGII